MIQMNEWIYFIGGFNNNQELSNKCEKYNIINQQVYEVASMQKGSAGFGCCIFNQKFIYKIGGLTDSNIKFIDFVERYNTEDDKWEVIKISIQ